MKRIMAILLIGAMLCAALVGCGKETPDNGKSNGGGTKDNPGTDTEITVHPEVKGTVTVGINSNFNTDYEAAVEAFQKVYPNVTVEPIVYESGSDDALEYLTAMTMAGKKMPDIIYHDAGPLPSYIRNGWVYPLTSFVEGDEAYDKVPENLKNNFTYNNNIYALGYTIYSNALLVNEDLVEEMNVDLPENDWTWDDFTEFIKACTNEKYSGVDDLSNQYNWMPGAMTDGCSITGYQYDTNTFNMEAVRKYVNYYSDINKLRGVEATSLKQNSSAGKSDYAKKFGDVSGTDAAFMTGKVASTFTGTWSYATWVSRNMDFTWEYYPVPQTTPGRIPLHVDYCWMTTDIAEENVEAAWAFLRYVTYSKEGNIARLTAYDEDHIKENFTQAYYIPCTTDEDVVAKFESLPFVTDSILYIQENIPNGYLGDPEKTIPDFEEVEYTIIGRAAYEAVTGKSDFSARMKEIESNANTEIAKYKQSFDEALKKFETEFAQSH